MNIAPAQVDDEATDLDDDPFRAIIEEQAKEHAEDIETMQRALQGDEAEDSSEDDEDTSPDGEQDDAEETAEGKSEEDPATTDEARRPGIDEVLRQTEERLGPEFAEVIRGLQRNYTDTRTEWKSAQDELRTTLEDVQRLRDELLAERDGEEEEEAEPSALDQLRPEQREMFRSLFDAYASEQGYVRKQEIETEKADESSRQFVSQDIEDGLERWGEEFGRRDDEGKFVFNDEVSPEVATIYERIFDPSRGVTAKDLYVLARHDALVEKAVSEAKAAQESEQQEQQTSRRTQARRAMTESRSAPSIPSTQKVYKKGESIEDTVARAAALAYRERNR